MPRGACEQLPHLSYQSPEGLQHDSGCLGPQVCRNPPMPTSGAKALKTKALALTIEWGRGRRIGIHVCISPDNARADEIVLAWCERRPQAQLACGNPRNQEDFRNVLSKPKRAREQSANLQGNGRLGLPRHVWVLLTCKLAKCGLDVNATNNASTLASLASSL